MSSREIRKRTSVLQWWTGKAEKIMFPPLPRLQSTSEWTIEFSTFCTSSHIKTLAWALWHENWPSPSWMLCMFGKWNRTQRLQSGHQAQHSKCKGFHCLRHSYFYAISAHGILSYNHVPEAGIIRSINWLESNILVGIKKLLKKLFESTRTRSFFSCLLCCWSLVSYSGIVPQTKLSLLWLPILLTPNGGKLTTLWTWYLKKYVR